MIKIKTKQGEVIYGNIDFIGLANEDLKVSTVNAVVMIAYKDISIITIQNGPSIQGDEIDKCELEKFIDCYIFGVPELRTPSLGEAMLRPSDITGFISKEEFERPNNTCRGNDTYFANRD